MEKCINSGSLFTELRRADVNIHKATIQRDLKE